MANRFQFKDEYYADGEGGRKAALDLSDKIRSFLQASRPELPDCPIMIKAYANEAGLSHFLASSGVINAPRDLVEFAKDFTQASEYTDFLLVGSGKDRADKKISGKLHISDHSLDSPRSRFFQAVCWKPYMSSYHFWGLS